MGKDIVLPEFFRLVAEFALFACACDFEEMGLALASEIELVPFGDFLVRLFRLQENVEASRRHEVRCSLMSQR